MKSSEFMDKQIMELSRSHSNDFSGFNSPQEEEEEEEEEENHNYGLSKDDLFPAFDFHSFRPLASSHSHPSTVRNCSSLDHIDSAKVIREKVGTSFDAAFISMIDQKMKEHVDNLLYAVEGLSARLSQLESRARHLENSVDELKESAQYYYGSTDGKLRQLENIVREVQGGVQDLRDKQEIAEAQLQLAKLQVSKGDTKSEKQKNAFQTDSLQETSSSARQQFHQPPPIPINLPQVFTALPANAPHPLHHNLPPPPPPPAAAAQLPTKLYQNQVPTIPQPESYYLPRVQPPEATHQQYHMPPTQQSQPPPPAPHQPYQVVPQIPQISQSTQLPQPQSPLTTFNPQVHPTLGHHLEGTTNMPSQFYHHNIHPLSSQPAGGAPHTQQCYMSSNQNVHDQTSNRPNSEFSSGFSTPPERTDFNDRYPYRGSSFLYGSSTMKSSQLAPPPSVPSDGTSYPGLPTAQMLPNALPIASSVSDGSGSGGTGNRIPIDDVVDKVAAMGFRRDLVRAMVKKRADNGQSIDLNVVLDKLINDGEVQTQTVWSGR